MGYYSIYLCTEITACHIKPQRSVIKPWSHMSWYRKTVALSKCIRTLYHGFVCTTEYRAVVPKVNSYTVNAVYIQYIIFFFFFILFVLKMYHFDLSYSMYCTVLYVTYSYMLLILIHHNDSVCHIIWLFLSTSVRKNIIK